MMFGARMAKEEWARWALSFRRMAVAFVFGLSGCALDYATEDGFFDRAQAKDVRSQIQELHECPPGKHWGKPPPQQCARRESCPDQCLDDVPPP